MDFGADKMVFRAGMICWYFVTGEGTFQVNSQQYWEALPREEILGILYRHDRRRLDSWLAQREATRARARAEMEEARAVELGLPQIRLGGPGRPKKSEKEKAFNRKLRLKPRFEKLPPHLDFKLGGSRYYAAFPLSDHDWIQAMFWLYSQQRTRLLA